jgi:hypothetical protein
MKNTCSRFFSHHSSQIGDAKNGDAGADTADINRGN